jgi:glutamyl-tRNA synthetase
MDDARRASGRDPAIRFRVSDEIIELEDRFAGKKRFDVSRDLGDFVIAKADGTPAYQLAVVVDDAKMGMTHIVRGDDLLDSTPRQMLLYRALGLADRIPIYYHLPLVTGPDGRRLAKRHGDTRLSFYRDHGVPPAKVLHLLAHWCGMNLSREPTTAGDLLNEFDLARVPSHPIIFTPEDDARLRGVSNPALVPLYFPLPCTRWRRSG